ncbi:GLPGLI family protein [Flavobacterium sp. '19STA2R22 D10 B1']|uniref:GLPGLI family protein n=1 Tax=Flavobacterium aerium TaxID=3037261 RepID=UPI00278BF6F5|nr:GLPGLI family protein [Flavobacterium sp. '19STA2R22 D10 B1']
MKNRIAFALLLTLSITGMKAQSFQGMAVYESKTSMGDFKMEGKEVTDEMRKMVTERMKKALEKTFILNFDKSASIYEEEKKLDAPNTDNRGMRMMASFTGGGGKQYKNIKDKQYIVDKEFMGKEFLIKDSLQKIDWKLENETKKIGEYTCYKATAVQKANPLDFRNLRKKEAKEEEKKSTNLMDQIDMPKEIIITAWYTSDIPVNQGPENYWGLPGLILEVNTGKTTILCSKVVLNPKEKTDIKPAKNGKVVTQKEYDDIVLKKMEEMKDKFRDGKRGNGNTIRIGN